MPPLSKRNRFDLSWQPETPALPNEMAPGVPFASPRRWNSTPGYPLSGESGSKGSPEERAHTLARPRIRRTGSQCRIERLTTDSSVERFAKVAVFLIMDLGLAVHLYDGVCAVEIFSTFYEMTNAFIRRIMGILAMACFAALPAAAQQIGVNCESKCATRTGRLSSRKANWCLKGTSSS